MKFIQAGKSQRDGILKLYEEAKGSVGCAWTQDYPGPATYDEDMKRGDVFCLIEEHNPEIIVGAISIDEDPQVDALPCWTKELLPGGELARLVVSSNYQNQGIAPGLIREAAKVLAGRGTKSVHFLVSKTNERALRSYKKLQPKLVGESDILEHDWFCYEIKL